MDNELFGMSKDLAIFDFFLSLSTASYITILVARHIAEWRFETVAIANEVSLSNYKQGSSIHQQAPQKRGFSNQIVLMWHSPGTRKGALAKRSFVVSEIS